MSETKWRSVGSEFYKFEKKGQEVVGVLVAKGTIGIKGQETTRWEVQTPEGLVAFLGGVSLDIMLNKIDTGTMIKIVYKGKVKTLGGTQVKEYDVFVADEE